MPHILLHKLRYCKYPSLLINYQPVQGERKKYNVYTVHLKWRTKTASEGMCSKQSHIVIRD